MDILLSKAGILNEQDTGKYVTASEPTHLSEQKIAEFAGISLHFVQDSKEYIFNVVNRYLPFFLRPSLILFSSSEQP
jgi:hypothetical protein